MLTGRLAWRLAGNASGRRGCPLGFLSKRYGSSRRHLLWLLMLYFSPLFLFLYEYIFSLGGILTLFGAVEDLSIPLSAT